jgi:hypothetical protein
VQVNTSCHTTDTVAIVTNKCVSQTSCTLAPSDFPPAPCSDPYLAVQVTCSDYPRPRHTYWNFTAMDAFVLDFWNAVQVVCFDFWHLCVQCRECLCVHPDHGVVCVKGYRGTIYLVMIVWLFLLQGDTSAPIMSFSTQPTWLYSPTDYVYPDNASLPYYAYDRGTAAGLDAAGLQRLGDYYGRVFSWYTQGEFVDEYGQVHTGGHELNITMVEVRGHDVCNS